METIEIRAIPQDLKEVGAKAILKPRRNHAIKCRFGCRRAEVTITQGETEIKKITLTTSQIFYRNTSNREQTLTLNSKEPSNRGYVRVSRLSSLADSEVVDVDDVAGDASEGVAAKKLPDLISKFTDNKQRVVIGLAGGIGRHFLAKFQRPWGKTTLSKQIRIFLQAVEFANGLLPEAALSAAPSVAAAEEREEGDPNLAADSVWEIEQDNIRCAVVKRGIASFGVRVFIDGKKITETFPFNLPGAISQAKQLVASLQGWTKLT